MTKTHGHLADAADAAFQQQTLTIFTASGVTTETFFTDGKRFYSAEYVQQLSAEKMALTAERHKIALAPFEKPE